MTEKERLKLLKEISEVPGISGYEKEATRVVKKYVENNVDEISYDNLGSLIALKKGDSSVKCLFSTLVRRSSRIRNSSCKPFNASKAINCFALSCLFTVMTAYHSISCDSGCSFR